MRSKRRKTTKLSLQLPPHVHRVVARGREYFYYHLGRNRTEPAQRIKLPGAPQLADGTPDPEFWQAYKVHAGSTPLQLKEGSFAALVAAYQASPEWAAMSATTRLNWTRYLAYVTDSWGSLPVAAVKPVHCLALRDTYADMPPAPPAPLTKPIEEYKARAASANNLLRAASAMIGWAVPRDWREDNPFLHIDKLAKGDPWAPWSIEDIELFRSVARPKLSRAMMVALYTGQRQGDCLAMLRSDVRNGMVQVVQEKTGKKLWIPLHRDLATELKTDEATSVYLLTNDAGQPWSSGFRASWNEQMKVERLAPLRDTRKVFHGLRKSAVVFLLEAGAETAEVSAVTGQSLQMVEHYAREVNQRKLAARAILKWEQSDDGRAAALRNEKST